MERLDPIQCRIVVHESWENLTGSRSGDGRKKMSYENKTAAVQEEVRRMNQLPSTSSYAVHRLKVLNNVLQLLSSQQRTTSQEEQLELLLSKLSLS